MSNRIIEAEEKMGGAAASIEKKARQLVYDARYEFKVNWGVNLLLLQLN